MVDEKSCATDFIHEALRIVDEAQRRNIVLRFMGGYAIRLHCSKCTDLYENLERKPAHDLDFVSYSKHRPVMKKLFADLGYSPMVSMALMFDTGKNRAIYKDEAHSRSVDVFFDKLEMCHTIFFKNRLELDYPTITLSDLFLQKIQIVKINEKDIKDIIILLREHEILDHEKEAVNVNYIAKLLATDWGFWYTATANIDKVKAFLDEYKMLSNKDREDVRTKLNKIFKAIQDEPKSLQWKLRAKLGTSRRWYTEVEELIRYG